MLTILNLIFIPNILGITKELSQLDLNKSFKTSIVKIMLTEKVLNAQLVECYRFNSYII